MWKQKSDTFPTSNCFQLIEEQVSKKRKKKSYALCVLPLAWTPVHEMRDQTKSRELTSYHQGNKTTIKIYFCSFIPLSISRSVY